MSHNSDKMPRALPHQAGAAASPWTSPAVSQETKEPKRRCPACQSDRVQWSHSVGLEHLIRFFCIGFYRCRHCKHRFFGFRSWGTRQLRIALVVGGLAVAAGLVWLGILYFSPRFGLE
jgi:hypothetical protein